MVLLKFQNLFLQLWNYIATLTPVGPGTTAWHCAVAGGRATTNDPCRTRHVLLVLVETRVDQSGGRTVDNPRGGDDAAAASADAEDV